MSYLLLEQKLKDFKAKSDSLKEHLLGQAFRPVILSSFASKLNVPETSSFSNDWVFKKHVDPLSAEIEPLKDVVLYDEDAVLENLEPLTDEYLKEVEAKEGGPLETFSLSIILNEKQLAARDMAFSGNSFVLTGPAGTGKTTATRAIARSLLDQNALGTSQFKVLEGDKRKYNTAPSIAFVAYTRRAAANLAKAILKDPILEKQLRYNIMTIHSLLEFQPETYVDYTDPSGPKEKFRFAPQRTAENPLDITHLVIEESSMLDAMTLWKLLYDALPSGIQIIFIGDINQLPPVFGPSILNYALVQLPVIELTEVYRNQGIVLENAHNILAGRSLKEDKDFVIVRGKSNVQIGQHKMAVTLGALFNSWLDQIGSDGRPEYDPEDCIILSPFNKQDLGTDNLNAWIAQYLGQRREAIVYEVIAGFNKVYLAVGDRIMYNKMDGIIEKIEINAGYHGKMPQIHGKHLSRFGMPIMGKDSGIDIDEAATVSNIDYTNFSLEALENEKAERKQQASHFVTVKLDNGATERLSAAGDFGTQVFSLGYALTVHKAQGSEWRKVFIVLHKDQAVSLYRELFYTAVTRAKAKVTIIAKDFVIDKAIANQRIKGKTIEDKIAYFNSGIMDTLQEPIYASK